MIPEAAVEAAARAICAIAFVEWTPHVVQNDEARVALAASAPHIRAQALTEAVDAFPLETISAPDNAVVWLLRRADQVRSQA